MKSFLPIVILFFCLQALQGQINTTERISIQYKDLTTLELIKEIETKTKFRFYFLESWLDTKKHSGTYENALLTDVLETVFKETLINYHLTENHRIILTKNLFIRKAELVNIFNSDFVPKDTEVIQTPILFEPTELSTTKNITDTKVYRIGKEFKNSKNTKVTLSGHVYKMNTNNPLSNIVVTINEKNSVTDSLGFYAFNLIPGSYTVKTSAIGVQSELKKVILYNSGVLDFYLEDSSEMLNEVVIIADQDKNIKEVKTGITQIKVEDIKTIPLVLGERDILKVAATLPGIKTAGEGSMGYSVRGGKTDQNLIMLDEGVVYNPTHFFGLFSAVNPFTTGTVKIYKGSAPAEYGGRLSSVFDISTKNGDYKKFKGEVSVGPVTSNITLETPIVEDKSSLIFGARGTYSNWILRSLDSSSFENSSASFYDFIIKYSHKINDKNDLEATAYYSYDDYKVTSDSLNSYSNNLASVKWKHYINNKKTGSVLLANSQYKFNIDYESGGANDFDLGYQLNETHLKLKMDDKYNDIHQFDYGLSSKLYVINPGYKKPKNGASLVNSIEVQQEKALESALFFTDNITLNDKFNISLGVRYSLYAALGKGTRKTYEPGVPKSDLTVKEINTYGNNEVIKTYNGLGFKASTRYAFTPSFSLKASFNNSFQYIQSLSNNTTASPTDTWRLSDNNIKPQESSQITIGAYKNLKEDVYELSVEGYYKQSKNILDYKVGADLLINPTIETEVLQGVGKAYGIEFLVKKKSGKLNGWLGYTYSRSFSKFQSIFSEERINNGNFFPSNIDKPHDVSLIANYKMTKRFSWSLNFTYQTGRPVTYPVGKYNYNGNSYVFYSDHNKYRIPDYYRLDIGLNIEGNHKIKKFAHSFWNISIYNVLGRNNPYSVFFVTKDGKVNAYKSTIFSVPVPTVTYNFKF